MLLPAASTTSASVSRNPRPGSALRTAPSRICRCRGLR
jgi:hypothetical protein